MPKKHKQEDPAQYKRFVKDAKKLGCDETGKPLEELLKLDQLQSDKPEKS